MVEFGKYILNLSLRIEKFSVRRVRLSLKYIVVTVETELSTFCGHLEYVRRRAWLA